MSLALNYNDVFVRMPLGCDMTKLIAFVKSMGGMAVCIPDVGKENKSAASVDEIFGVWSDENYPSADEMCGFLKESRTPAYNRDAELDAVWQ